MRIFIYGEINTVIIIRFRNDIFFRRVLCPDLFVKNDQKNTCQIVQVFFQVFRKMFFMQS